MEAMALKGCAFLLNFEPKCSEHDPNSISNRLGWLATHARIIATSQKGKKIQQRKFVHNPSRPSAVPFPPLAHALIAEPNDTSASTRSAGTKEI
jgi:hypothetical protein